MNLKVGDLLVWNSDLSVPTNVSLYEIITSLKIDYASSKILIPNGKVWGKSQINISNIHYTTKIYNIKK